VSLTVQTSNGVVPFDGRLGAERDRPVLLVVGGIFPAPGYLLWTVDTFAEADVLVVNLPGMNVPFFTDNSVPAIATTYAEALERLCPARPVIGLGVSTGALPVLAMGSRLAGAVLVEPFLQPAKSQTIRTMMELVLPTHNQAGRNFAEAIFGLQSGGRDYRGLLDTAPRPLHVLVGGIPPDTPERMRTPPSAATADDRARLRSIAGGLAVIEGCGHDVTERARGAVTQIVRRALAEF
jgi:hypothetical protein